MAMEINGSAILSALATNPSAFAMSEVQINALAMQTIIVRLKDKAVDFLTIRSMAKAIGGHDFSLTLDTLQQKEILSIAKRLDPKNTDLKDASEASIREHIAKLASGSVEPVVSPPKTPKPPKAPPKPKSPKMGEVMKSQALKARKSSGKK